MGHGHHQSNDLSSTPVSHPSNTDHDEPTSTFTTRQESTAKFKTLESRALHSEQPIVEPQTPPTKILCISNINGDKTKFDSILRSAGIINNLGQWIAKNTELIFLVHLFYFQL